MPICPRGIGMGLCFFFKKEGIKTSSLCLKSKFMILWFALFLSQSILLQLINLYICVYNKT